MPEQVPPLSRHDLEAKIVKHCWEDEAFRKEFIANPAATFVKHLKVPLAKLPKIAVHEEAPGTWHIVLPAKPGNAGELSEEDLEKIAGGGDTSAVSVSVIGSVLTVSISISVTETVDAGW